MAEDVADFVNDLRHLGSDADERAIKRAYAKALKVIRPDEDAAGFQQLNEAYQAALAGAAWRARNVVDEEPYPDHQRQLSPGVDDTLALDAEPEPASRATVPAAPVPVPELQATPLDVERFARSVVEQATRSGSGAMSQWLGDRPELWSLVDKPRIGHAVLERLHDIDAPIHEDTFDTLAAAFGWNELRNGVDPLEVRDCRTRLQALWLFRQETATHRALLREPDWRRLLPVEDDPRLVRLRRPWNRLRALVSASLPGRADGMDALIGRARVQAAHVTLQPRQVQFWLALCRSAEINGPKLQLAAFRSALLGAALAIFLLGLGVADGLAGGHRGYWDTAWPALVGGLMLLVGGSLMLPLRGFMQWQIRSEHPRTRIWVLRRLVIPILSVAALWIMRGTDARPWGVLLAWPVAALALARLVARGPFRVAFRPWMIGLAVVLIPALKYSLVVLAVGEIAVAAALLLWLVDAVNHVSLAHAPRRR